ncbi:MAG: M48 family metalloprotease [Gammaproteobacteria bacterium]|uniref:M48 family metalloprotease n=1 Tax=Pseudomaricurvus alcaniphilus TaxID=1166482 RepID=UPI00140A4CF3|nr:M48 family metalloprotease [Pseudomaricurvus alcaniphilus]MBR9909924.1 M48 family metalloprotease [Gammaproteobacteria bacterium]NHN38858.1 M48 family metalloprotease [Pseudomaricurvus alcaniphilus]
MTLRYRLAGILLTLSALAGCTTNPVTGESQFTIISPQQEVAMGAQQYGPSQQSQGGLYMVDPELSVYVNQVGQKLAAKSGRPDLPYEFVVLNNDSPNAWALPGGKIAINRGLLVHLQDEAQLAAVLGHEVVHAAARHGAQQMTQSVILGVGTQIAVAAGGRTEYGQLIGTGAQLGSAMYQARYGREQELEADRYGMLYMARAGYDPDAAVELQETFLRLAEGRQSNWLEGLFASHPPSAQRVEANREHAAKLTGSNRNQAAYQRAIAQINRDKAAYAKHQEAIAAANSGDFDKARSLVNQAMKLQPREALFPATMGQLQLQAKNFKQAISYFEQSHKLYPEYYLPLLGSGIAARQLKSYQRAEQDLVASSKLLPTQAAAFYLGEVKLAQGDKQQAITYFQHAAQAGGELGEKSQAYLQELVPTPPAAS